MAPLMGKKIVVIGGSSGIGLGVAEAAVGAGAEVVIVSRSQERLAAAERRLAEARVTTFAADMTKETEIALLFDTVGAFDHLVSTAGAPPPGDPIADTDVEIVRRFIDSKLIGAVLVAKYAAGTLRRGGSMTFTSGINKDKPPVPGGAVVTAIAGTFGYLAHALALELAPTRVNIVSPGAIYYPGGNWETIKGAVPALYDATLAQMPMGRFGEPEEVAKAIVFMASPACPYMTGAHLVVDGGFTKRVQF